MLAIYYYHITTTSIKTINFTCLGITLEMLCIVYHGVFTPRYVLRAETLPSLQPQTSITFSSSLFFFLFLALFCLDRALLRASLHSARYIYIYTHTHIGLYSIPMASHSRLASPKTRYYPSVSRSAPASVCSPIQAKRKRPQSAKPEANAVEDIQPLKQIKRLSPPLALSEKNLMKLNAENVELGISVNSMK